ncbi:MAG: DUF2783 domain-containing protein [Acetobacteraceae bacterium]|nr:DUF2783 domain-containing protein [Acetobacteraceae bacterium]
MRTDLNIPDPDAFYEALLAANEGLSERESLAFALRLVLLLANQIGDQAVLMAALAVAKQAHAGKDAP